MPIAAFGLLAATVLGLGALTAADIDNLHEFGDGPWPGGSHQHHHPHFDQRQPGGPIDPFGNRAPGDPDH